MYALNLIVCCVNLSVRRRLDKVGREMYLNICLACCLLRNIIKFKMQMYICIYIKNMYVSCICMLQIIHSVTKCPNCFIKYSLYVLM